MADYINEIKKRRTFAIISHPDAGKTTLTEKFLLYGGAIRLAGSVKARKASTHAVSDWMEIEKQRGISVTSSVMQFNYAGHCINNSIQSALKKVSRLKDIPQSNIVSLEEDYINDVVHLSAEDEYLAKESVSTLSTVLYEELSSFENEVLRLHIVGCSYNEIAFRLSKTPKAIDNALQRVRRKLSGISL